jgi:TonB-linked SusC/RagA family outer membrane protein
VVLKGTTTGTVTDAAGNYKFQVPLNAQTLAFSFVGMKSQEIQIGNKTVIHVVLAEETMGIEEVVAIGYGTVKRKDLTGPVSSVSGQALKDIPVTSASQAIAGRMPGVQVTRTEGSPDAEIKIRVRGGGSLTQDNSPLFIVDGFPVNNINDIAPTDIESIDVLKDASSTAIYGARGANGVILITTKSGGEGKGKVSYNTYFGVKEITKTLDVLDPYEFVLWQFERFNTTTNFQSLYGDFRDYDLYKQMKGTNWQEKCLGETGTSMYHNISASGGIKNNKYQISLTRNDEKEIMVGSGFSRTNFTIRTSHTINNWLSVELNTRLSDTYIKGAGTSANARLYHMVMYRPVNGLIDFTGTGDEVEADHNILDPYKQTIDDYKRNKQLSFYFNGNVIIKISKNLNYRLEYGSMYGGNTSNQFYGPNNGSTYLYGWRPMASITKTDASSYRLANILNYSKPNFLPGSNMNVTLGQELNSSSYKTLVMSSKYFSKLITPESALINMGLGTADPNKTSEAPDNRVSSFFGRVNYDYKGKYLASATFRADGSSKFAPGNQWGYFPSAGLAWRIIEEGFLGSVKKKLSDLKLRASFGMAGNNRISDDAWKKTFYLTTGGLFDNGDGESATATTIINPNSILSNPELKWETTITRNLGVDFGFFKQRLSGSVELYKNTTKDLLIKATVPASSGYKSQWQNIGQTSNKGIEIVLNGTMIEKKDFRLSASFNIGINRNHIDKLGEVKSWEELTILYGNLSVTDFYIKEGGQIGQMYGFVTDGMYSFDDFYYANGTYTLKEGVANDNSIVYPWKFMPGALKLKDQNGDFVVNNNDKVIVGNANPKHTGGFNLTAQMKGFDISTFFNWVYGNDIYNANKLFYTSTFSNVQNMNTLEMMNYHNRFSYLNKETGKIVTDPIELAEINKDATVLTLIK